MKTLKIALLVTDDRPLADAVRQACAAPAFPAVLVGVLQDATDDITHALTANQAQLVCVTGNMPELPDGFVEEWRDRMIAMDHNQVYYVRANYTESNRQAPVILRHDFLATRNERPTPSARHELYIRAIRLIAECRVNVSGDHVFITKY